MAFAFTNPPPPGAVGDFTSNPVYDAGSYLGISWTVESKSNGTSLALWQLQPHGTDPVPPFEYLPEAVTNDTVFNWLVNTNKNLTYSNTFILTLFADNDTTPLCNSHYFEIGASSIAPSNLTTSTSSSSPPSTPTPSSTTTLAFTTTPVSISSSSSTPSSTPGPSRLSVGAKIGFGLGIPAALFVGLVIGWLLFGRRRRRQEERDLVSPGMFIYNPHTGAPVKTEEMLGDIGADELPASTGRVEAPECPQYELQGEPGK